MIDYCEEKKIPVEASMKKPYSMDRNLLHISYEAGMLEDPWLDASAPKYKSMYKLSVSPEDAPNKPECITLDFNKGNCVRVNGKAMTPLKIMQTLNRLGGKHGIGRVDMVENRFVGMKSRGVYETPGGTILHATHRMMESITMDREVMHLRDSLTPEYSKLVYNGFWYAPEREALQALITESQQNVSGTVRVKLYKGNIIAAELFQILNERKDGIGLAANQVGIDAQVAVVNVKKPIVLINPKIVESYGEIPYYEGCLNNCMF